MTESRRDRRAWYRRYAERFGYSARTMACGGLYSWSPQVADLAYNDARLAGFGRLVLETEEVMSFASDDRQTVPGNALRADAGVTHPAANTSPEDPIR